MPPPKILIIGAGIAGNALATLLLLSPLPIADLPLITIVERSAAGRSHGQNIDVRGTGIEILRRLDVEDEVRAATTGEEGVRIVDGADRVWGQSAADKSGRVQTGTSDVEVLRGRLVEVLERRVGVVSGFVEARGGGGVVFVYKEWVERLEQDGGKVRVLFANSREEERFDLVVGADGLQSLTRRLVWGGDGEEGRLRRIGAYGGFFSMPKGVTDGSWRRWYQAPGRKSIMVRPSGQPDRSTVFMVVVNDRDPRFREVAKVGSRSVADQKALFREYFADAGWESERIVAEMERSDDFYYDVLAQVKMESWSRGRVVLLGDAGYCASPFSGMGTTLALNGAYNLAGALLQHGLADDALDYTSAFTDYEAKMRPLVERAQKLPPGLPHLIHPETVWGVWALRLFCLVLRFSGIGYLLAMFAGPPARAIEVEEFGFGLEVKGGLKYLVG